MDCTFLVALARSETAYVIVILFFYLNVSLKDKLVIELKNLANVDSLRSRKFVCSLKVVDSSSWIFFLRITGGVVLVLMIRVSDRIVDVPCEINSLRWDKVCLVQQTVMFGDTMPYDSSISRLSCGFWLMDS